MVFEGLCHSLHTRRVAGSIPAAPIPRTSVWRAALSGDSALELLRAVRGGIAGLKEDVAEVKERLGILESQCSSLSRRVDRIGGDAERIKRRLDPAESPAAPDGSRRKRLPPSSPASCRVRRQ